MFDNFGARFNPDGQKDALADFHRARVDAKRVQANEQDAEYEKARNYNRTRPPFIGTNYCAKCGNFERFNTQYKVHDYANSKGEVFTDEWLARSCSGCGFKWNEAIVTK